jgi:hypothetical protein
VTDVRVVYRKFDGRLHWQTNLRRLGEDEHGVWLGTPPGGAWQRAGGPWVTVHGPRLMVAPRPRVDHELKVQVNGVSTPPNLMINTCGPAA